MNVIPKMIYIYISTYLLLLIYNKLNTNVAIIQSILKERRNQISLNCYKVTTSFALFKVHRSDYI